MEKYKTAKRLLSENKFETAIESFKDSFNSEVLNENEKIDCLTQIIKLQKLIKKKDDNYHVERDLADFLIKREDFTAASEILKKLVERKQNYDGLNTLIETLIKDGQLLHAEEYAIECFKYLYRNKNYQKIIEFHQNFTSSFPESDKFQMYKILALVGMGKLEDLSKETIPNEEVFLELMLGSPFNHWRHSKQFREVIFKNAFSQKDYNLNKIGMKLFLETLLIGEKIEKDDLNIILSYFLKVGRKAMARQLCNYAEANQFELEEKLVNRIDSLPEDQAIDTDFDMGEDLLGESESSLSDADKLLENIELLKTMGEDEEAEILVMKLKRLYPEHPYFQEAGGTTVKVKRMNVDDIEETWNSMFVEEKESRLEMVEHAKATLRSIDDVELLKNYRDLIYSFNSMELYEASLQVMKRLEKHMEDLPLEIKLEINYLNAKSLIFNKQYYQAYDLITQVNGSSPLAGEKRIEFLYLQGEVARKLGRTKDAIKSYLLVKKINPDYRLVRQRLQSFG